MTDSVPMPAVDQGRAVDGASHGNCIQGYHYVVVSKLRERQFDPGQATEVQSAGDVTIKLQRVQGTQGEVLLGEVAGWPEQAQGQSEYPGRGHLFISVLAYHFVHTLRRQLKAQGINDSWNTLRQTMATILKLDPNPGRTHRVLV